MAGTILISEKTGVPLSSGGFEFIIEEIRKRFRDRDSSFMENIYRPYDHEGMMFISLIDSPKDEFVTFLRAAEIAFKDVDVSHWSQPVWAELIELLSSDVRNA
ncbi:hypothetical protein Rhein_1037 [Rheinheimera sp. A13L]|uniref:hypothetical protein n=1 Tax=Rheinheimera sp. A13L TaxID=506534 RepID=UPI00021250D1|nr:hypothetical protein [Rheinheimera sp. A13L]EGM78696.1 hypothetical protein Rhein_1037 [Rheinheimera sp. A13L]